MEEVKKGKDDEEVVSEEDLVLKKKQMDFEKKKASGVFELNEKKKEGPSWFKWVILGLIVVGLALMVYFMGLI